MTHAKRRIRLMNYRRILGLFLLPYLWSIGAAAFAAEPKKEALVDQVKDAIDRGVKYLREVERGIGHWEVDFESNGRRGGWSSLAMLALLNSGVKPDDPVIERGLKFLRNVPPESTYVVGLQTMVFAAAGRNEDRERIQRNVEWLIKTRVFQNNQFVGWGYGKNGFGGSDNSNTQYALLGLHEAHVAGAKIDRDVWKSISDFYKFSQHPDGGWGYSTLLGNVGSSLTMSTAGLCGLLIAGQELNDKREK